MLALHARSPRWKGRASEALLKHAVLTNESEFDREIRWRIGGRPELLVADSPDHATSNVIRPTEIVFRLRAAGPAELAVFDLRGRRVQVLREGVLPAGEQRAVWDGRDEAGRILPSGTYLARLVTRDGVEAQKLVLVQ